MKKKIEKKGEAKKGRPIILFRLDRIEIDTFGRVIIKDPWLTQRIKELKAKRKKFLAVNALCLPDSYCPPQVSGDSCGSGGGVTVPIPLIGCKCPPPDNLCTCVAQCGCSLTLCDCA